MCDDKSFENGGSGLYKVGLFGVSTREVVDDGCHLDLASRSVEPWDEPVEVLELGWFDVSSDPRSSHSKTFQKEIPYIGWKTMD